MLFLLFELNQDRYALDTSLVVEVLPLIELKEIPLAPAGVAGLFNYRGEPVPVLDVSEMMLGRPAQRILSTRVVLIRQPDGTGGERLLGLIVEKATRTWRRDAADFTDSGVVSQAALGSVAVDEAGAVQWVHPQLLLSNAVRDILFRSPVEAS